MASFYFWGMKKDVLVNGVKLYVQTVAFDAVLPTIIFLHDSLGAVSLWRDFPATVGQLTNCNVLVYDRQGYGESAPFTAVTRENNYLETEADTLIKLMDAFDLKQAILFGHSDGGSIALIAAAKYPERIQAIITEGAHIFVEEITLAGIRDAVHAWQTTDLKFRLAKYHRENTEGIFHAWIDTWLNPTFRDWSIEHFLPSIKCPVLVIQGEKDEFGSMEQVNGIMNNVSGKVEQLIVPGVGHTPHKESKEVVVMKTTAFIREVSN